jgi:hypothetical protein
MYDLCFHEVEYKCVPKKSIQNPYHHSVIKPYMTYFLTIKVNAYIIDFLEDSHAS